MKFANKVKTSAILLLLICTIACKQKETSDTENEIVNKEQFTAALETHLKSVKEKNIELLKSTLQPNGTFYLTLPQSTTTTTAGEFIKMHEDWFKQPDWTMETKIMNSDVCSNLGVATVESLYKEKERNGKPYFNKMAVTYSLKKIDNKWYVIRDHACSIEKTEN